MIFLSLIIGAAAAPSATTQAAAGAGVGAGQALISPALLFVLCVAGAVAMMLVLPGRRFEASIRWIGGVALVAVVIVLGAVMGKLAAGVGVFFWIFSAVAVVGAVRVITHTKPVYSALYFVLTVMATAGLFVLMWAEFMAAALILIYAGAILVTYVFVIMLAAEAGGEKTAGVLSEPEHDAVSREPVAASAVGFALVGILLFVIFDRAPGEGKRQEARGKNVVVAEAVVLPGATQRLGAYLFRDQLVNLELAGLILTVAMVGAILIARRRVIRADEVMTSGTDVVVGPATPIDDNPHSIPVEGTDNPRQKAYPET